MVVLVLGSFGELITFLPNLFKQMEHYLAFNQRFEWWTHDDMQPLEDTV